MSDDKKQRSSDNKEEKRKASEQNDKTAGNRPQEPNRGNEP